jgi:hypothetical protein
MLDKECPIIEVNLTSVIDKGNNVQVMMKAEEALPRMFKEYYKLATGESGSPKVGGKKTLSPKGVKSTGVTKKVSPKGASAASKTKKK